MRRIPSCCNRPTDYSRLLLADGFVRPDFDDRRRHISTLISGQEKECGGQALVDADLLDEVTAMVEWPVALVGRFDKRFLSLPRELLVLVMQKQQRFFPVRDSENGKLMPWFIGIADRESADTTLIRRGYERVLSPRLEDAAFFWQRDRSGRLADKEPALADLVFHRRLGSMRERSGRIADLAAAMAAGCGLDEALLRRAAELCKCDLLTGIVGEFPELQGVAGGYYATHDGEPEAVAAAIGQHYRPVNAAGALPDHPYAGVLAVADKLDVVCAVFSVHEGPTAEADPFAVRRAAIGSLRILAEMPMLSDRPVGLTQLIRLALRRLNCETEETEQAIVHFFRERWRAWHLQRGVEGRVFDAVAALGLENLPEFERRLQAVSDFLPLPPAAALAEIHKRVRNILRQAGGDVDAATDAGRFTSPAEKALADRCAELHRAFPQLDARGDYHGMLRLLAESQPVVDDFFVQVKVMDDDIALRQNRLSLLADLSHLINRVADLSRLSDG